MGGDIMELRNYANECYMLVRRNDLRKDIENGYISHEQANQYLAEYAYELNGHPVHHGCDYICRQKKQ